MSTERGKKTKNSINYFINSLEMADKIIVFIYNGSLQEQPKKLQKKAFVQYWTKRIKLQPGQFMNVDTKLSLNTFQKNNIVANFY